MRIIFKITFLLFLALGSQSQSVSLNVGGTISDETKTTMKIPTVLLDEFKHLAIDEKTTVTALIVESMKQYLKYIKKK